ncbi:RGS domain-containing protein [Syncephalis fuscata]|nr:RGS domain-containing protein [Syncephalis fuscata]
MLRQFYRFASKDFCAENVLFCSRLQVARYVAEADRRKEELREIFNLFILPGSRYEVNINCNTQRALIKAFSGERDTHGRIIQHPEAPIVDVAVFDDAREEVMTLMYQNTYPRYLEWQVKGIDQKLNNANSSSSFMFQHHYL